VFQERGLMHVFTGDTLARRPRGALALEPVEFMTNAFNRPECREALALAPGAERSFRFGVEVGEA
jgi:aldose 1-epimerase